MYIKEDKHGQRPGLSCAYCSYLHLPRIMNCFDTKTSGLKNPSRAARTTRGSSNTTEARGSVWNRSWPAQSHPCLDRRAKGAPLCSDAAPPVQQGSIGGLLKGTSLPHRCVQPEFLQDLIYLQKKNFGRKITASEEKTENGTKWEKNIQGIFSFSFQIGRKPSQFMTCYSPDVDIK